MAPHGTFDSLARQRRDENLTGAEALFHEGNRHMTEGNVLEAEACFLEALWLVPGLAEVHANLGLLLDQAGRQDAAEGHYLQSIAANPAQGQTRLNLGCMLAQQKRFDEAAAAYRNALELMPESAPAWSNLGVLQACRKQEAEAERSYRTALALDANYPLAKFNLSYLLLRQGRFEEGWACFEARNWYAHLEQHLDSPRWRGESLTGKSLLIGFEAGHGDMIQFCRYAPILKAEGAAQITLICHPGLKTLFASLRGVDLVVAFDEPLPPADWDFWTPPLSIPLYCRTRIDSIPAALPYLQADSIKRELWASRMSQECVPGDLRVGLAWQGNPRFENDADRSLPDLATLAALGTLQGVRFFSLQKGTGESEAANPPAGLRLTYLGPQIADFADTAAIIANLDLVICVDTAVAHLAGAMDKACWVMLPDYKTDWRWLAGRRDSPWYPGVMRLFRQSAMGNWTTVVTEVQAALHALAAGT